MLARYTGGTITVGEFEQRYTHAVGGVSEARDDSLAAYRAFLDQYLDFRLKVRAARLAGYAASPSYRADAESYQLQTARPRLIEREVLLPIVRTLYERRKEEIDVSHILLRLPENPSRADTIAQYMRMQSIVDTLNAGMQFSDAAEQYSEDPSAQRTGQLGYRGHLGYLTAGRVVEPFEDMMYNTPVGRTSPIFRTPYGYHVLRVHDRRPRQTPIRVSHILIRPDSASTDTAAAREQIGQIKTQIEQGADFAKLAQQYSQDQAAVQGGDLGYIQSDQRIESTFREAAFALKEAGDVSDIVATPFGYHLIKLTERKQAPTFEETREDLEQLAARLPRTQRAQAGFAASIQSQFDVAVDTSQLLTVVGTLDESADTLLAMDSARSGLPFASIGDSTYTLGDLAAFARQSERPREQPTRSLLDAFLDQSALLYAARDLEARDDEYKFLMDEYREGLLLFQYMQDSVWTAAVQDTTALRATYEARADAYTLPERVRTIVLRASSAERLSALADTLRSQPVPTSGLATYLTSMTIEADTVFVTADTTEASVPYTRVLDAEDGAVIGPLRDDQGSLLLVRVAALPARPRTYEEARSSVVQDYQETFEARVVDRLRERFDAETYPARLRLAFDRALDRALDRARPTPPNP